MSIIFLLYFFNLILGKFFTLFFNSDFHVILNIFKLLFHIYTGTISFALSTLVLFCQ